MDLDNIPKEEEFLLKGHVCNRQEFFDQGGFEEMAGTDLCKLRISLLLLKFQITFLNNWYSESLLQQIPWQRKF